MHFNPNLDLNDFAPFVSSLISAVLGSCLTAWWTGRRNKRELCLRVYDRWNSTPLTESRKRAFNSLRTFFKPMCLQPEIYSNELVKLSVLQHLSEPRHNYVPPEYLLETLIDDLLYVMSFLSDLNKLMEQKLIDEKLARTIFKNTVLPWYVYFDKLEFDLSNEMNHEYLKSEVYSLRQLLE